MKKKALVIIIFCFAHFLFSEDNVSVQILIPAKPYIGDICQLKTVFSTDAGLISNTGDDSLSDFMELSVLWSGFKPFEEKCLIQEVILEKNGREYTLSITFIPWQTGILDFSSLNLSDLIDFSSEKKSRTHAPFIIKLKPVTVSSLVEKTGDISSRPAQGPFVLPGTIFSVVLISAVCLILFILLVVLLFHLSSVAEGVNSKKIERRIRRLNKKTVSKLKKLLKISVDSSDFCDRLFFTLREYLCLRFDESFASRTSGEIFAGLEEAACSSMSESQAEGAETFVKIFSRLDYLRFASGSLDSQKKPESLWQTEITAEEKKSLVEEGIYAIIKLNEVNNAGI